MHATSHIKSYELIYLEQRSQEWLDFRKNKIGASDAAVIMGLSPWKTAYQLWNEKKGGVQNVTSPAMQRGIDLESEVLHQVNMGKTSFTPEIIQSMEHPWMIASLDGLSSDGDKILEIKCPGRNDHDLAKSGIIPEYYQAQLQHQMAVGGFDSAEYVSYRPEDEQPLVTLKVLRDNDFINKMMKQEMEFYNCMVNNVPPPYCEKDFIEVGDPEFIRTAIEWRRVKALLETYDLLEKDLRNSLIKLGGQHNCKGGGIKLSKIDRKGSIKYDSIPELANVDLESYRGSNSQYWKVQEYDCSPSTC